MNARFKTLIATTALACLGTTVQAAEITGAGASFPDPVYSKWAADYARDGGDKLNYQAIGSGGGVKQITAKTVDFGASDAPLTAKQLEESGMVQFPMVMGGIVPVVNVKGIKAGEMKLSGAVLADLFLGNIRKWNDPAIQALNPDLKLPSQPVYVVHRSDGSGTTFNFSEYLARVSPEWKSGVGVNKALKWPAKATKLGGKGNAGVANYVARTPGAIGYVEYAYATANNLAHTQMQNRDGHFVQPTMEAFQAAAANADWANAPGFHLILNDQPGKDSWPMTAATFILMHKQQDNPDNAIRALRFFDWAYASGDDAAKSLHYVPMPDSVVEMVKREWQQITDASGKQVL
jgi:phosphate transport system substrate-binding protein